ncbi:MAG: TIGR01777 family oxidoreductase [Solirubrobacterales bacterium]
MRVTLTGATGLIGTTLLAGLQAEGAEITVLSRDPERAAARLGVPAERWDPLGEPAPPAALEGRDAVVHLAGEPVAQRWSADAKRAIRESRVIGTRHLVEGIGACAAQGDPGRPKALVSASAIGYYGAHGEEPLDEEAPPGSDFLAEVCTAWEAQARGAQELGVRAVQVRTGVVLDPRGGALAKMLPPFRLGVGGPVAGGHQYVSWIHVGDLVGMMRAALADERWSGPVNGTAPEPVTNRELSRALGRALHRPALLPVPGAALRALYGEMAQIVTTGARVLPAKPLMLGYEFRYPHVEEALRAALGERRTSPAGRAGAQGDRRA